MARKSETLISPPIEDTVKCCHDTCFISARVKIETPTGWANFCLEHLAEYRQRKAVELCHSMGLDTVAKRRDYVMRSAFRRVVRREPGEDWEEVA